LIIQTELYDYLYHGGGVLAVDGQQHLSAAIGWFHACNATSGTARRDGLVSTPA